MCRSVPQIDAASTRIRISFGPGDGTGTSSSSAPGPGAVLRSARIVVGSSTGRQRSAPGPAGATGVGLSPMTDPGDPREPRDGNDPNEGPAPRGVTPRAIHDGTVPQAIVEEPVGQPIWLTADYLYDSLEHYADVINERRPGYVYGRTSNPTHVALHNVLASLEGAEAALSFASGMGALHSTLTALTESGGHVVAQRTVYGGTFQLLT